ncbi:MAG: N-acetylmuramoyl-L-alanine amidase [Clostridia bacterium]|nr:N-acetylmuramoyl-L-alanine amidase [Clostridia bacterium]
MFKVFKLKKILAVVLILVISGVLSFVIINPPKFVNGDNFLKYTIVLDAGHGGRDDGCSGVSTGVTESELNLKVVKKLKKMLEDFGFKVVLTRENQDGLYEDNVDNYKVSDMEKRKEIIENAKPNFVISIHHNSFSNSHQRGAQAFWQQGDDESMELAKGVQAELVKQLVDARQEANFGDYYILKCVNVPTILIECGYLTNAEEEALLIQDEYQNKIAYAVVCGLIRYFNEY